VVDFPKNIHLEKIAGKNRRTETKNIEQFILKPGTTEKD
jgi:hypothetical protein